MVLAVCSDEEGGNSHQFNELLRVCVVSVSPRPFWRAD
jgi:hypothetical protein